MQVAIVLHLPLSARDIQSKARWSSTPCCLVPQSNRKWPSLTQIFINTLVLDWPMILFASEPISGLHFSHWRIMAGWSTNFSSVDSTHRLITDESLGSFERSCKTFSDFQLIFCHSYSDKTCESLHLLVWGKILRFMPFIYWLGMLMLFKLESHPALRS